jgi:putative transposon-encoded protein
MHHRNIYIYKYIVLYMSKRKIKLEKGKIELKDEFELIFEKIITKFGNGAKIDAPKELLGKKVYVVVRK